MSTISIVATVVGLLGGLMGLVGIAIAAGRWVGSKDKGAEQITAVQAQARDDTRFSIKRIEEQVMSIASENKVAFGRVGENLRPLLDWHATRSQMERELTELRADSRAHRERLIRIEAALSLSDDDPRGSQPRARTRTPVGGMPLSGNTKDEE